MDITSSCFSLKMNGAEERSMACAVETGMSRVYYVLYEKEMISFLGSTLSWPFNFDDISDLGG